MEARDLSGKVVVITGASSGFGKGAAMAFAAEGAVLALGARRVDLLQDLADECRSHGARSIVVRTDVSEREDVEELARAAITEFGRIDVWVNNAGVGALGCFERIPLADHQKVIETSLLGTLYGSWFAYRQFREQESGGVLINVASELGRYAAPYYSSYAAAKHGVVGLGDSLRQEIDENQIENVHVCTLLPTAHDTPFFDHAANYTGHAVQAPEPLHDPRRVIDAIVRMAKNPKDEEIVGGDGIAKVFMKRLAPDLAKKMGARKLHKAQIEEAPPAADSAGAVRTPIRKGTEVSSGRADLWLRRTGGR